FSRYVDSLHLFYSSPHPSSYVSIFSFVGQPAFKPSAFPLATHQELPDQAK
ncbi:hypothetical protein CSUI_003019, partial [Cystoisospora suis]